MIHAVLNAFDTRPADEARIRLLVDGLATYRRQSLNRSVFERRTYSSLVRAAVGLHNNLAGA